MIAGAGEVVPFVCARGGKAPGLAGGGPLGRRALVELGEKVGEARAAAVHAGGRLGAEDTRVSGDALRWGRQHTEQRLGGPCARA